MTVNRRKQLQIACDLSVNRVSNRGNYGSIRGTWRTYGERVQHTRQRPDIPEAVGVPRAAHNPRPAVVARGRFVGPRQRLALLPPVGLVEVVP